MSPFLCLLWPHSVASGILGAPLGWVSNVGLRAQAPDWGCKSHCCWCRAQTDSHCIPKPQEVQLTLPCPPQGGLTRSCHQHRSRPRGHYCFPYNRKSDVAVGNAVADRDPGSAHHLRRHLFVDSENTQVVQSRQLQHTRLCTRPHTADLSESDDPHCCQCNSENGVVSRRRPLHIPDIQHCIQPHNGHGWLRLSRHHCILHNQEGPDYWFPRCSQGSVTASVSGRAPRLNTLRRKMKIPLSGLGHHHCSPCTVRGGSAGAGQADCCCPLDNQNDRADHQAGQVQGCAAGLPDLHR